MTKKSSFSSLRGKNNSSKEGGRIERIYLKKDECGFEVDKDDDDNKKGEVALWRAVITQALMDAGSNSAKKEMRYEKAQAIAWLAGNSKDFKQVCVMADMEPEYVRSKAKEAVGRGCVWRNEGIQAILKKKKKKAIEKKEEEKEEKSENVVKIFSI